MSGTFEHRNGAAARTVTPTPVAVKEAATASQPSEQARGGQATVAAGLVALTVAWLVWLRLRGHLAAPRH